MIRTPLYAFLILLVFARPAWPEPLGVAAGTFPDQWGNPFSSTSITRQTLWSAIFDPLTLVTSDGELLPWLAHGWTQKSPNEWHIELRQNVIFSNGEPLTAESVVAAVDFLLSDYGRATPVGRELVGLRQAESVSDMIVILRTTTPDPLLPYKLSLLRPVAAKRWGDLGPEQYFRDPAGTGPYVIDEVGSTRTQLRASSKSWRRAPTDTLDYLVLVEPAARQAALATGEADIAITALSPDEFEVIRALGGDVFTDRIPAVVTLSFITEGRQTPFADQRVREAMIHAVNREALVSILLGGATNVSNQPAPSGAFGFASDVATRPHDPEKAKALLIEAGYADGFSFTIEMPGGAVLYTDIFQQIAADLARVGVNMTIQILPQVRFLENIQTGQWKGDAIAMPMFTPTSDALYPMRQNSCAWHAAYYCDQDAMPLIEHALMSSDVESRKAATEAVMRHAHLTAQAVFLYETVSFVGLSPRIANFRTDYGFIRYETIELTD